MSVELSHEEGFLAAGEYVLGLSSAEERKDFGAELSRNATLRAMVDVWEGQFVALNKDYQPLKAPDVWPFLDRALFSQGRKRLYLFRFFLAAALLVLAGKVLLLLHIF